MRPALATLAGLAVVAMLGPTVTAHPIYRAIGHATTGLETYEFTLRRFPDFQDQVWFNMTLRTVAMPLSPSQVVLQVEFRGTDNMVNIEDPDAPPVNSYHGQSDDATVTFSVDGFQSGNQVVVWGEFEGLTLYGRPDIP